MIKFTEDLEGRIINTHNNSIIRFSSDRSILSLYCDISITDVKFRLYPNKDGLFYFNFKEVIISLVDRDNYKDSELYDTVDEIIPDKNSYINADVTIKIVGIDLSEDEVKKKYHFVRAVAQQSEWRYIEQRGQNFPLYKMDNNVTHIVHFRGYPFDLAMYGNINIDSGTISTTHLFLAGNLPYPPLNSIGFVGGEQYKVNRLILSNGKTISSSLRNLYTHFSNSKYRVIVETREVCEGIYLKFLTPQGAWGYWHFQTHKYGFKNKQGKAIVQDFDNSMNPNIVTDVNGEISKKLYSVIDTHYLHLIQGLLSSPAVYIYNGSLGDKADTRDWIRIYAKGNISAKSKINKHKVTIDVAPIYTQSL